MEPSVFCWGRPASNLEAVLRLFFLALACGVRAFSQGPALFGFLPNTGQFPPAVRFVRHSSYGNFFYLTRDALVLLQ